MPIQCYACIFRYNLRVHYEIIDYGPEILGREYEHARINYLLPRHVSQILCANILLRNKLTDQSFYCRIAWQVAGEDVGFIVTYVS